MSEPKPVFDFASFWRSAVALAVIGAAWASENQAAFISAIVMALVWGWNVLQKTAWGRKVGRAHLTIVLYVISMVLSILFNAQGLPAFPEYVGDPALYAEALATYVGVLVGLSSVYVGGATAIYNILVKEVLDKLTPKLP